MALSAGAGLALKNLGIFVAWLMEKEMATHSSILAWKTHGWRRLAGYCPWGHKESD